MSLKNTNLFAHLFNEYFTAVDANHVEGEASKDTGQDAPSTKDKRFQFFIKGIIQTTYLVLAGDMGARSWLMQQEQRLDDLLKRYHDEDGNCDLDVALTDPRVIQRMDYVASRRKEVEAYEAVLNEAMDAYEQIFNEKFDLTTIELNGTNKSSSVRKVTMSDEDKAQRIAMLKEMGIGKAA